MLVYCGQTVGRIKMKLGTQLGLGHIVLDGDPAAPPQKGGVAKYSDFGPIEGYVSETVQDRKYITIDH